MPWSLTQAKIQIIIIILIFINILNNWVTVGSERKHLMVAPGFYGGGTWGWRLAIIVCPVLHKGVQTSIRRDRRGLLQLCHYFGNIALETKIVGVASFTLSWTHGLMVKCFRFNSPIPFHFIIKTETIITEHLGPVAPNPQAFPPEVDNPLGHWTQAGLILRWRPIISNSDGL